MSEKLLPCPFCGGDAAVYAVRSAPGLRYAGRCHVCGLKAVGNPSEDDAAQYWNTRHVPELSAEDQAYLCDLLFCGLEEIPAVLSAIKGRGLAIVRVRP